MHLHNGKNSVCNGSAGVARMDQYRGRYGVNQEGEEDFGTRGDWSKKQSGKAILSRHLMRERPLIRIITFPDSSFFLSLSG
jgi:hypothetical protein